MYIYIYGDDNNDDDTTLRSNNMQDLNSTRIIQKFSSNPNFSSVSNFNIDLHRDPNPILYRTGITCLIFITAASLFQPRTGCVESVATTALDRCLTTNSGSVSSVGMPRLLTTVHSI